MADNTSKQRFQSVPVKIFLPVTITLILFGMTIFLLILPILEKSMMDGKREMIHALTESAWSALDAYAAKAAKGELSRSEAQARAIEHLRGLRYGPESKDYFWINDMRPYLVMHPYRRDLEGKDISDFTDPNGKHLFVAFVKTVQAHGAGYVDYQWQWKDDPQRIVPKISFVKGFKPWGWIIGTGIYVEDVHGEIASITRKLTLACLAILLVVAGLSSYVIWQSADSEKYRRQAETALRKSEAKYRLLAETAREFIIAFDLDGQIVYANRAGLTAMGYAAREIQGMPVEGLLPVDQHEGFRKRLARRIAGDAAPVIYETRFVTRDGDHIPVEVTSALLLEQGRPSGVFITARDITEKKQADELAHRHQEQLYQAGKLASIGTLVSGIAHEINNPITSVLLNAQTLEKVWQSLLPVLDPCLADRRNFSVGGLSYGLLRERMPLLLSDISDGSKRVKGIVSELKDFARQGPSDMTDTVDINHSVKRAIGLVSHLLKKSTDHFSVDYGAHLPVINGNAQRIEQVVINLVVNACQALSDTGQSIQIHTGTQENPTGLFFEVRDQGRGMAKDTLDQIKDPFFTTRRDSGGTGLGLAVSDRIVQDHGGTLTYRTIPGQGTRARVCLPLAPGKGPSQNLIKGVGP